MLLCVQSGKAPTIIHHHSSMPAFTKSLLPLPHFSLLFHSPKCLQFLSLPPHLYYFLSSSSAKPFSSSSSSTPYPLQYDMIISHPCSKSSHKRHSPLLPHSKPTTNSSDSDSPESQDLSFEDWVDKKLTQNEHHRMNKMNDDDATFVGMDKSKSKYYNKRNKRMYGSDSDDERRKLRERGEFVELKPQVVELRTLHKREEELFFYDTFAMPWEKDKHYKMVYQLEKKYFPDQCLDKAFLEPGMSNSKANEKRVEKGEEEEEEDKGLVFFEEGRDEENKVGKDAVGDISEKKVEDFFKGLKKFPKKIDEISGVNEPFLASRSFGLPPKWDSPAGTVVLINKPKGWTSFTVCGKLRRLTKVKKVGHAGTLDPMATGLLIVCVGKATKVVDRYQGMIKGYSGVFRLGEATSTWDADSPVIQREPWEHIKDEDIRKAAASFTGEIWQVPPMFSAIKVGGEKMYDKARRGESIELSPRRISIFQFDIERSLEDRQNLIFRVTCSKGTYIRSLCADLGKTLGSCAHLTALRRDSIGEYTSDDAYEFQELEEQITKRNLVELDIQDNAIDDIDGDWLSCFPENKLHFTSQRLLIHVPRLTQLGTSAFSQELKPSQYERIVAEFSSFRYKAPTQPAYRPPLPTRSRNYSTPTAARCVAHRPPVSRRPPPTDITSPTAHRYHIAQQRQKSIKKGRLRGRKRERERRMRRDKVRRDE